MEEEVRGKVNRRIERGMAILSLAYQIEKVDENTYIVNSQSGSGNTLLPKIAANGSVYVQILSLDSLHSVHYLFLV